MSDQSYPFIDAGMSNAAYHARPEVSASRLKTIDIKSPAHALVPVKETPAMRFGTLAHCAVLEPETLADHYRTVEGDRRRSAVRDEIAAAEEIGFEVITPADRDRALRVSDAVRALPDACRLIEGASAQIEVSHFWIDPATGLACRARPDLVAQGVCVDLKTTRDASPDGFGRAAASLAYPIQAAHYLEGLAQTGEGRLDFAFIAVETEPPFAAAIYDVTCEILAEGQARRALALRRLARTQHEDHAPAYPERGPLCLPSWGFTASPAGAFSLTHSPQPKIAKEKRDAIPE